MLRATAYIMACSAKNHLSRRLLRLKEPRYLFGALVGSAYLYFAVFGRSRAGFPSGQDVQTVPMAFLPSAGGEGPVWAGLSLLATAALSFILPLQSGLLDFTKAETEFLFPAPVPRRELVMYRLVRSQWAVFFSALIISITYPLATGGTRLRGFVGTWLLLMTCRVFFQAVTLTRRRPATPSMSALLVIWLPRLAIGVTLVAIAVTAGGLAASRPLESVGDALTLLSDAGRATIPSLLLSPFVAPTRPLFAESFRAFALVLPAALTVYAMTLGWVLMADAAAERSADSETDTYAPKSSTQSSAYRARPTKWTLALHGWSETPFVWKTATQMYRVVSIRPLIHVLLLLGWATVALIIIEERVRGIAQLMGLMAAAAACLAVLIGPQLFRLDLRQDLQHLDLLKTWPVRPGAVVRGEMLAPSLTVTAVAWAFGAVAIFFSATAFSRTSLELRLAAGWAGMVLAPALVLAQYTIHNAAALLFPAWIATGGRPRGVDAIGQRLIMLAGTWLTLLLAVLPAAAVAGLLWLAFYPFVGPWILLPGAAVGAAIVVVEVLVVTQTLGRVYERLDITSVERVDG
jgi:hypothetical protein